MINSTKTELRKKFKNVRNSVDELTRIKKSKIITDYGLDYLKNKIEFDNIMIYQSFSSEVITGEFVQELYDTKKNVLIPHCDIETETMTATVYNFNKKQTANVYGISEFINPEFFEGVIDVIIVPGIAFDKSGNRIGFGKGYYDKFIKIQNPKPFLIGLAYHEQIYSGIIPTDKNDVKMNVIITDKGIMEIG